MTTEVKKSRGHLALIIATLIFGLNGPFSKILLSPGGIIPEVHILVRFVGATFLFWLTSYFLPSESVRKKDRYKILAASLLGVLGNQGIFALGISMTSPVDQSLISTLGPIITMILAAIFLHEPITLKKAGGVLVGATGVVFLVMQGMQSGQSSALGNVLCGMAMLCYTLYLTLFKDIIDRYSPITLMKWMFLISTVITMPFFAPAFVHTVWRSFDLTFYLQLGFVVFFSTFIAYMLLPIGQKALRPTVISSYNYAQPVLTTSFALLLGLDRLTLDKVVAAILVFTGVYLVTRSKSKADLKARKRDCSYIKT
ncbi:DMT family transporter [Porphyromonas macacae]|uniref:DMT family transporter n=1 Tax=Porphyromonas macacae TaxID=28115 RepID=UPI0024AC9AF9|nr:DMT family transporter [Porphyromonas macacae]